MNHKTVGAIICLVIILFILSTPFVPTGKAKTTGTTANPSPNYQIIGVATFVDHVVLNKIRDSLLAELKKLGYTPEKGWRVVVKSANGSPDQAATVADELLNLKPACVISISTPSTKPLFEKNAGRIAHIYSFVSFPSSIGITDKSKNTTGLADGVDFEGSFALIKEFVPKLKRIGMVYSSEPNAVISKDEMLRLSKAAGVEFIAQAISQENEIVPAVQGLLSKELDAFFIGADSTVVNKSAAVIQKALDAKVPVFATDEGSIGQGALAGLSVNYDKFGRETAHAVDSVIKAKSADAVPDIRYLGKDLQINLTSAKQLGLIIPTEALKRASKVYGKEK